MKEKVDLSLRKSPIEIHEIAEANEVPARPRKALHLLIGFFAGGAVLFLPVGVASMYTAHAVLRS